MLRQFVLWKWEQPGFRVAYLPEHVNTMCSMIRRHMKGVPHRIVCVTDSSDGVTECETAPLWLDLNDTPNASGKQLPSCYRRLKLYDPKTQKDIGIDKGDRIISLDLDSLVTGPLTDVVDIEGKYVGWELSNHRQLPVFNGSLQMFTAGTLQYVWEEFDPLKSPKEAFDADYRGSDQAWLSYKLIGREGSVGLKWPLVASYPLQNRMQGILKRETSLIFFHGREKPWSPSAKLATPWIERYYR